MDRRGFIAGGISAFLYAIFPFLRPKLAPLPIALEELSAWQNIVMWNMVRGYDLRWQIGQHTNLLDDGTLQPLRVSVPGSFRID